MNTPQVTDLIVKTGNPAALDRILQTFGAVVVQSDIDKPIYMQKDGGYGEVIKTLDELV